jgi:eukaryotic-like serine/threonine-protein kinase
VDIRADVYALGATFYYLLAGEAPYSEEKSAAGKLLSKEKRPPKPIRDKRPEVPEELTAVVAKMMAKEPADRYQTPKDVVTALASFTTTEIPPPPESEMPQLALAARGEKIPIAPPASPKPPREAPRREPAATAPPRPSDDVSVGWLRQGIILLLAGTIAFAAVWLFVKK